jgi:hypothetical protein
LQPVEFIDFKKTKTESKQSPEIYSILYPKIPSKPSFSADFSLISRPKKPLFQAARSAC